jgi:hypothetical protein
VREERLGQVNRQATEEEEAVCVRPFVRNPITPLVRCGSDLQKRNPGNVFEK